jgi:hypothetical protein
MVLLVEIYGSRNVDSHTKLTENLAEKKSLLCLHFSFNAGKGAGTLKTIAV